MSKSEGYNLQYRTGRLMVLIAAMAYSASRGLAYLPWAVPVDLPRAIGLISFGGALLPVWSLGWMVAALLCLADITRRHSNSGLIATVGMMFGWGFGYLISGVAETLEAGEPGRELLTAGTYMLPALMIFGYIIQLSWIRKSTSTLFVDPEA